MCNVKEFSFLLSNFERCIIRVSFWKDHLVCTVAGELEGVESRGRDSNKKPAAAVQVRDDEGWCGGHCGALPRSFSRLEPLSPAVTADASNGSQLPFTLENYPPSTVAT